MSHPTELDSLRQSVPAPARDGDARSWLLAMQECVRERDYEAARELFSPRVFSFGTLAPMASGADSLERDQWREVWSRTTGFSFDLAEARFLRVGECVCIAAPWRSLGVRGDGSTFERRGRATLVLAPSNGGLVAVHSHFSLWPEGET
jgi:ketosteroid isomerase-like protein